MGEATIASKKENLIWLAKNCKQREENNQRMSEHYDAEATSLSKVISILDSEDMFINFLQTKEAPKYESDEYFLFQDVIDECQKQISHIDEEGRADAERLEECKTSEASKKKVIAKQDQIISDADGVIKTEKGNIKDAKSEIEKKKDNNKKALAAL